MKATIRSGLVLALVLLPFAAEARAQLDLPGPDRADQAGRRRLENQSGNIAPYLVCTVCGERNYTAPIDPNAQNGLQAALCVVCQSGTVHKLPEPAVGAGGGLELSAKRITNIGPGEVATSEVDVRVEAEPPPPDTSTPAAMSAAATFILDELSRTRRFDDALAVHAVDSLLALGDAGLAAARVALGGSHGPTVITCMRVLLIGGDAADADRVVTRMRRRLPNQAAAAAVEELVRLDPVRATPRLFVELLTHPQMPVRMSAERALEPLLDASLVPLLGPVLDADNSDARVRAIHLLMSLVDDPTVLELLLDATDDPKAKVAWQALSAVARSTDPRVELELLRRAFGDRWILRPSAYALLAIVEREDLRLVSILGDQHAPALLSGLASNDPFVAGSCATALAGIGFRSTEPELSAWLDREVPETLVAAISGQVFFNDYSSLQGPALRRLKLITGISFGTDGPRWSNWWLGEREHFHASRATLAVAEGDERDLAIQFRSGSVDPVDYVLVAPGRAGESIGDLTSETVFLTGGEARDVIELLRREEVLGPARLPGVRGGQAHHGRTLDLSIRGQSKRFVFGPGASEPWFDRIDEMVRSIVDRNRWQRFPHPDEHVGSRQVLWQEESAWWAGDHDERSRALRLKTMVLAFIEGVEPDRRPIALAELERLYEDESIPEVADFPILLGALADEPFFSGRAARISELARHAIGMTEGSTQEPSALLGRELIRVLHDTFGEQATVEIAKVLQECGQDAVLEAARDERPLLRAVAATVLAIHEDESSRALLLTLLDDDDEAVEVAAVMAAGDERVEVARTELLLRARLGTSVVREAALRAIGRLGGESVFQALLAGLSDGDVGVKVAAAEGLADLQDPRAIPLLVSLLRQGRDSGFYEPVRRGLLGFGEAAWEELLSSMRSSSRTAQRESALLLAYQGRPSATSTLIRLLTENPDDRTIARELAVLTCVDYSSEADPAALWWDWWDTVRKDDALSWFRAALKVRDVPTPPTELLTPPSTEDGVLFLLEVMSREEAWLVERARRELTRLVGRDLGDIPPPGPERRMWLASLADVLAQTWE